MSTKAIREALEELLFLGGDSKRTCATYDAAIDELRRIERAAQDLDNNLAAQVFASNPEKVEAALKVIASVAEDSP